MTLLPNETKASDAVQNELSVQLAHSDLILRRSIQAITDGPHWRNGVSQVTKTAAASLFVRSCRLFRQAICLTRLAQADGAEILCRSMYDGLLSLAFVCRDSVELTHHRKDRKELYAELEKREFRAKLYLAFSAFNRERDLGRVANQLRNDPECDVPANLMSVHEREVGKGWTDILRGSNTCAGLNFAQLAENLDMKQWHELFYPSQSDTTHGSKPERYVGVEYGGDPDNSETFRFNDDVETCKHALWVANGIFAVGIGELANVLDTDCQAYRDLGIFASSLDELESVFIRNVLPPWCLSSNERHGTY